MNLPFLQTIQGEDPIVMEAEFSVPVSRLYAAWTTPEDIRQWFGAGEGGPETAVIDLREGGRWEFTFAEKEGLTHSLAGVYMSIKANKFLQFTWVHSWTDETGSTEQSAESVVSIEFRKHKTGSITRLEHKGIAAEDSRRNVGSGWSMSFNKIKALVE